MCIKENIYVDTYHVPLCEAVYCYHLQLTFTWTESVEVAQSPVFARIVLKFQYSIKLKKLNSVAFSPQANYTDRATSACRWS
jgi:hypothetical protein